MCIGDTVQCTVKYSVLYVGPLTGILIHTAIVMVGAHLSWVLFSYAVDVYSTNDRQSVM